MLTAVEVVRRVGGVSIEELEHWVENRWIVPNRSGGSYVFAEIDLARVRLIREMRQDLAIEEEAVPVMLSLLDQIYALRRDLRQLCEAVDAQPEAVRRDIAARLGARRR